MKEIHPTAKFWIRYHGTFVLIKLKPGQKITIKENYRHEDAPLDSKIYDPNSYNIGTYKYDKKENIIRLTLKEIQNNELYLTCKYVCAVDNLQSREPSELWDLENSIYLITAKDGRYKIRREYWYEYKLPTPPKPTWARISKRFPPKRLSYDN